ncbi:Nodulin-like [Novymonas esmeraldas]|uniref:Nodulin-like n=1 Tax=Novymonas esmeraldas TaxID=1808958 RepID=A0AAW0F497_9TRYP
MVQHQRIGGTKRGCSFPTGAPFHLPIIPTSAPFCLLFLPPPVARICLHTHKNNNNNNNRCEPHSHPRLSISLTPLPRFQFFFFSFSSRSICFFGTPVDPNSRVLPTSRRRWAFFFFLAFHVAGALPVLFVLISPFTPHHLFSLSLSQLAPTRKMITAENYRINEISRFLILVGGVGASTCMSTFYGFNIISKNLADMFALSGADLTTITTIGIVIGFITFPFGMLLDYAGPMWVCICACTLNALGALLYALAFNGNIKGSVPTLSVFCAIMNLGCASFDTGSLMAVLGNFPLTKGPVVAIMKTFAGLGASILALINYSFFRKSDAHYMFFMTALVVFMGSIACIFIRFPPYHIVEWEKTRVPEQMLVRRRLTERAYLTQYPPMRRFYLGFFTISSLVVYLTVQSFCVAYANPSDSARMGNTIVIIIFVFCFALMAVPLRFFGGMEEEPSRDFPDYPEADEAIFDNEEEKQVLEPTLAEVTQDNNALVELHVEDYGYGDDKAKKTVSSDEAPAPHHVDSDHAVVLEDENAVRMALSDQDPQYQTTFLESIRRPDIWLCWWNTLATWGCGMVMAFNSAQIYQSLANNKYERSTNTMYSAIISVASALGRLTMGILEYVLSRQPSETRPVITIVYPVSSICMVVGLIFLLALPLESKGIVVGFFFDSFGNGFSWACTALTVRTLFAKDIGKHYNFMYVGVCIAVIALNRFAYGENYDRQAKKNRDADLAAGRKSIYPRCAGKACVDHSFIILLCVNATAIVGSTWCHLRYRSFVLKHRAERAAARAQMSNRCGEPIRADDLQ